MVGRVLNAFMDELEKIAGVPSSLKGLVRPSDANTQFQRLLSGYRKGIQHRTRTGQFASDVGFLTHDARSSGGKEAIENILDRGEILGSMGERAQYTMPGRREVYWHRSVPGVEGTHDDPVKMWFRGDRAEGVHADLARLAREGKVLPNRRHNLTGAPNLHIARTAGPYELKKGDIAILAASERRNLPELIRKAKDRGIEWASTGTQQDALRAAQLETYLKQKNILGATDRIDSIPADEFSEILEEAVPDPKKLQRTIRWWASAKPVTPSEVEARFLERLKKPYA